VEIHVTGAGGFLGTFVVRALADIGHIHSTDLDTMDVSDASSVTAFLRKNQPDIIIHLAALKGNVSSRERPVDFFKVNTLGTLNLLEACRVLGIKRFIFMSSLTVHGKTDFPVSERSPISPLHPYGASKAAAEALVHAYSECYGIRAVIFRPNFIVGAIPPPRPYQDNLIYDFIQQFEKEGSVELAGVGDFQREWIHVEDVAAAVKSAILADHESGCETFILAANRVTMKDLASRIARRIGKGCVRTNPTVPGFSLVSMSDKALRNLDWRPRKSIDDIIDEIWDEYRSRKNYRDYGFEPRHRLPSD
jgi:UDP-glucose 4-epimerase